MNQPWNALNIRHEKPLWWGLAWAILLFQVHAWAEASGGALTISRNGDGVNVVMDAQASADVKIRRSEDVMVIRIPRSVEAKLTIDPALRKESVVQEVDSAAGKMISIYSQQIYLASQEQTANTNTVSAPEKQGVSDGLAGMGDKLHALRRASKSVNAIAKAKSPTTGENNTESAGLPLMPSEVLQALGGFTGEESTENAHSALLENPVGSVLPAESRLPTAMGDAPVVAPSADPEALPLDLSDARQKKATQAAAPALFRIVVSLLGVLGLVYAFSKMMLPRLIQQYPQWFQPISQGEATVQTPPREKPIGLGQAWRQTSEKSVPHRAETSAKQNYLDRLGQMGKPLRVLGSSTIGKGKDLHLVEVQGRQLVIATTPYTVNFICDLNQAELSAPVEETVEHWTEIPSEETVYGYLNSPSPVEEKAMVNPTQTIAYLQDENPVNPAKNVSQNQENLDSRGAYATLPGQKSKADQVYLKYVQSAQPSTPEASSVFKENTNQTVAQPLSYIDAEEVIVLQDYDDVYGG